MYLFFDVETTGTIKDYKADPTTFPRIIQIAYQLFDEKRNLVLQYCELIKPDGWEVPKEPFWINKGYNTETNLAKGVPLADAIESLLVAVERAQYRIAHNISFDALIVRGELFRLKIEKEFTQPKICTMMTSTKLCKLPKAKGGGYKWPKLEELYRVLFHEEIENAHDALQDVKATSRCFFELVDRGVIELANYPPLELKFKTA